MRTLLVVFFILLLLSIKSYSIQKIENYYYPNTNPYSATLTSALMGASQVKFTTVKSVLKPERTKVSQFKNRHHFIWNYVSHKKPAPLLFLMPGLGGTSSSGQAAFLAEIFYNLGYHVVIVDNPFSWQFAISASSSGLPGFGPLDAIDVYNNYKFINSELKTKGIQITGYATVGYSMGALETAFVAELDSREQFFNFGKIVLMNPPIRLIENVKNLDLFYEAGMKWSEEDRGYVTMTALDLMFYLLEHKEKVPEYLVTFEQKLPLTNSQKKFLISQQFRQSLSDVIITSQQIDDQKILKAPYTKYKRNARIYESSQFSFEQYLQTFVYPALHKINPKKYDSVESVIQQADFRSLLETFKNNKNIYFIHNQDDFLYTREEEPFLKEAFDDRAIIYPTGGHCGNYWFPTNIENLKNIMLR